jgi:hypothetical protein
LGFIYVNNRFEGNALETIAGILEQARGIPNPAEPKPKQGIGRL